MDTSHYEQELMVFLQLDGEDATEGIITIMQGDSDFKIRKTMPIDIAKGIRDAFGRLAELQD